MGYGGEQANRHERRETAAGELQARVAGWREAVLPAPRPSVVASRHVSPGTRTPPSRGETILAVWFSSAYPACVGHGAATAPWFAVVIAAAAFTPAAAAIGNRAHPFVIVAGRSGTARRKGPPGLPSNPPMLKTASVRRLADVPPEMLRWTLDLPVNDTAADLSSGQLRVQGWMLLRAPAGGTSSVVVRRADASPDEVRHHPFNCGRPDVIDRVLHESSTGHPQLRCGFAFSLPASAFPLELGFQWADREVFWAASISFQDALQVIEGSDGWLFLDNDTNRSVDQYTGVLQLDPSALRLWRTYLAECRVLAARQGARHALVVAPSKEEVLRHRYPHARAATTVLDQVRAVTQSQDHFVDGAAVLSAHPEPEQLFKRTDTHWTDRGAMLAVLAVLEAMGVGSTWARECLAGDTYRMEPYAGDLGVKLLPPRKAPTEFLDGPAPEAGAVLDNRLPNIGRVLVFECAQAPYEGTLLMFGASSGYPMLKYLKRLFGRLVFVHSAGHVDRHIVEHERPAALLLQSNGRFLVQPPRTDFSLAQAVRTKLAEGGEQARLRASQLMAEGARSERDGPYIEMLKGAR